MNVQNFRHTDKYPFISIWSVEEYEIFINPIWRLVVENVTSGIPASSYLVAGHVSEVLNVHMTEIYKKITKIK